MFSRRSGRSHEQCAGQATPFDAVSAIKDHLAFYPERVNTIEERGKPADVG
jgi:uncharacterized protein (DUF427 family)